MTMTKEQQSDVTARVAHEIGMLRLQVLEQESVIAALRAEVDKLQAALVEHANMARDEAARMRPAAA